MKHNLTNSERLLTWLDIERVLKQVTNLWTKFPNNIHSIDCYHDGMDVRYSGEKTGVLKWLSQIFGKAFHTPDMFNHSFLQLRAGNGHYPINLEECHPEKKSSLPIYPLWRDVAYLEPSNVFNKPKSLPNDVRIISFHSFKGGVGRTTALMTYVAACLFDPQKAKKGVKVLIIDADLEAPGVSFWLNKSNTAQLSFVQFLEAMHYPPVSNEATLDFFADELRKTSMNVEGIQRELFILPAALDLMEIQDMPIQPYHLARNSDNPWILTDHLYALGKRLGVDAVFIDLRAGLSELSSPLIFDHRIEHYFVTTVAKQSVDGMCEVLKRLHTFHSTLPPEEQSNVKPSVIVSLLTRELRESNHYSYAKEHIEEAYPPVESLDEGVDWLDAYFSHDFMAIDSIDLALHTLKQSSLYVNAQEWARTVTDTPSSQGNTSTKELNKQKAAMALFNVCQQEYAEQSSTDDWLVTEPLRNLGKHYAKEIPNALMVGAKGAGKTFTYLQICKSQTWNNYLKRVGEYHPNNIDNEHLIFPVLWSSNLKDSSKSILDAAQKNVFNSLGVSKAHTELSFIENKIKNNKDDWNIFWSKLICTLLGEKANNLQQLNQQLLEQKKSVVLIFDGIEDIFYSPNEERAREAIASLLTLVNRLAELTDRRIGLLLFVRIDYVQAAIKQNFGQFLARFSPFQLNWNPESFLRLAYWLCAKAEIIDAKINQVDTLEVSELIQKLIPLWGEKLGKTDSKNAYSARWVYAALCDLTGIFQARDLVRFFQIAAEREKTNTSSYWSDRVLSPDSMRKAIPACSSKKVEEAKAEIAPLRGWVERMERENITNRSIPFSAASVALEPEELRTLRELGVIYEDSDKELGENRLFLPEIYRAGLNFDLSSGRPKIQALLKKNLKKLPF